MNQLYLRFARSSAGRTILAGRRVSYPFCVTAPIPQPCGMAQVILQSISGGLYGGENLTQSITAESNAAARLVQPAATTVRRKPGDAPARQRILLSAHPGGRLTYATRPLIMLPGAALAQEWEITISPDARVIFWDGFVSHCPGGEAPDWSLTSRVTARTPSGTLLATERMAVQGPQLRPEFKAFGKLWCFGMAMPEMPLPGPYTGLSALPNHAGFTISLAAPDGGSLSAAIELLLAQLEQATIPSIHIRQAVARDAEAITSLTHAAYAKWVPVIGRKPLPMTFDYADVLKHHRVDLLYENDTLAALIETVAQDGSVLIENLAVSPEFQKRGYARKLLAHIESMAISQRVHVMRLYTNQKFEENIKLYQSLGYEIFQEETAKTGTLIHMEKFLKNP